ncbi:MAG: cupin domain-containing protein [Pseudomonadota bacterium]
MPKIPLSDWQRDEGHHDATGEELGPSFYKLVTHPAGCTKMGAYLERLPPGSRSGAAHRHSDEDEFIFVLQGRVTLWEDGVETELEAGSAAVWAASSTDHHRLQNDTNEDAVYLVVGSRAARDFVDFAEHDFRLEIDRRSGELIRRKHPKGAD